MNRRRCVGADTPVPAWTSQSSRRPPWMRRLRKRWSLRRLNCRLRRTTPTVVAAQGCEEIGGAVETIAQDERVAGEGGQGRFRARHLAGRRVGAEVQLAAQPAPHI